MVLYQSEGILEYQGTDKLVLVVDPSLANYYRNFIPKWYDINRPKYPAHVTVVRTGREIPVHKEFWNKYQGEHISFSYDSEIKKGTVYFWLNIFCVRLEEIRKELGLPVTSEFTLPPEGFTKCFHMTLANLKDSATRNNKDGLQRNLA